VPSVEDVVLVRHDRGCRYARQEHGGHSDAAKRLSDLVNLHVCAGVSRGVIAAALSDGRSDNVVYPDRATAVSHQHHNERWYAFIRLNPSSMSVCAAESVMRFQRQQAEIAPAQLRERNGGLEVIPRLTIEDHQRQLAAMAGFGSLPIALGIGKE
jgi:hypothetical protein